MAHVKDQPSFQTINDEFHEPMYGVMTKKGVGFLYDYADHKLVSKLNWDVDVKKISANIPLSDHNIGKVSELRHFGGSKVSLQDLLYYTASPLERNPDVRTVRWFTDNRHDMRQKNLELLEGGARSHNSSEPPSADVFEQLAQCGMSTLPKGVRVWKDRATWFFSVKLPGAKWTGSKKATLSPQEKVDALLKWLTAEHERQGTSFNVENQIRNDMQEEFTRAMGLI